ncbi:hypothetical protein HNO88_002794 [Novosphingobium chloroacetimidivorans]|uniref:DUF3168 domain-containing protein n=1 Tax=Novosphingobium chloroacetimidivorans TaxID=1428314 RepID=A0A7W7KAY6_9SPHN|nr:DUF3168 domain-containing protein [Novosphingobium chloroacetimidivorans]MBB4859465.1 hypothetical protein [Novosphingobium chloroacetimidivorans]
MIDPSLPLQAAIYQALITAGVSNVYATVPVGTSLPWTVIGDDQVLAAFEAAEMYDCFTQIHVFGRKPDHKVQAGLVMTALRDPIEIDGFGIVEHGFEDSKNIDEKDNQIGHVVLTFRYLLQPI